MMIESRRDLFKLAILVCKIGIVLTFASIFLFWSATAILKFASEPINSNIRFHYGDDNNGKVQFPAVSICLNTFATIAKRFAAKRCDNYQITTFWRALTYCTHDSFQEDTETTTSEVFGNLFQNDQPTVKPDKFTNIEEVLNATKIEISDILRLFEFGTEVIISENLGKSERKESLEEYWIESIWPSKGFCYTFDAKLQNLDQTDVFTKDESILYMKLKFNMNAINGSSYYVLIHESYETLSDDFKTHPSFSVKLKDSLQAIVNKIRIKNLSTQEKPCRDKGTDSASICAIKNAQKAFEAKYKCKLPWMMSSTSKLCPILNETRVSYKNLYNAWEDDYKMQIRSQQNNKETADAGPHCQRPLFQLQLTDLQDPYFNPSTNGAVLKIRLDGPNIMVIQDFISYDFQSLIGEVGGTLGLFLGLSFLSIIECIEFSTKKILARFN